MYAGTPKIESFVIKIEKQRKEDDTSHLLTSVAVLPSDYKKVRDTFLCRTKIAMLIKSLTGSDQAVSLGPNDS